tara:strand:- start:236 stop:1009 length:774 start_codon:yes stop_codon:yes gene_type:complete
MNNESELELISACENLERMLQRLYERNESPHDPSFRGYLRLMPLLKDCLGGKSHPWIRTVALKVLSAMVDCRCSSSGDDCVRRLHQERKFVEDVIDAVAAADIVPALVRILLEKQDEETCKEAARAMVGMMIGGRAEQRQELVLQCTHLWCNYHDLTSGCSAVDRLNMALEEDYGAAEDLRADYEAVRRRIKEEKQTAQDRAPWFDRGHFLTGFSPLYRDVPTIEDGLDAPDRCRSGGAAVWPARERVCGSGGGGGR